MKDYKDITEHDEVLCIMKNIIVVRSGLAIGNLEEMDQRHF